MLQSGKDSRDPESTTGLSHVLPDQVICADVPRKKNPAVPEPEHLTLVASRHGSLGSPIGRESTEEEQSVGKLPRSRDARVVSLEQVEYQR